MPIRLLTAILLSCYGFCSSISAQKYFTTGLPSSIYMMPLAVAGGDFNNDGAYDIAVAGKNDLDGSGLLSILYGRGDGGFKNKVDLVTDKYAVDLQAVDLDNDGLPDLITANRESQTLNVFWNQKSGGFKPREIIKVKGDPVLIASGDFNKDRKLDLVAAITGSKELQFFKGSGYKFAGSLTIESEPAAIRAGDYSGNGLSHILVRYSDQSAVTLIAPNDLTAKMTAGMIKLDMSTMPYFARLGNLNGDAYFDAVRLGPNGKSIVAQMSGSNGLLLSDQDIIAVPNGTNDFVVGDFNKDGHDDIGVMDPGNLQVLVYLNQSPTPASGKFDGGFSMPILYDADFSKPNAVDMGMLASYKKASMIIYDTTGRPIRTYFEFDSDLPEGQQFALEWTGTDVNDAPVADGTYVFYYRLGAIVVTRVLKK